MSRRSSRNRAILIKLADQTKIYSSRFQVEDDLFILERPKYVHPEGMLMPLPPENVSIHKDAVEVWFVLHRGGLYGKI